MKRLPCRCGPLQAQDSVTGNCFRCGRSYRPGRVPMVVLDVIDADLGSPTVYGPKDPETGRREVLQVGEPTALPRTVWQFDVIQEASDKLNPTSLGPPEEDDHDGEG